MDQFRNNILEKLEKHRFLVLSRVISDADFDRISQCTSALRQEELSKLWASAAAAGKDDKRSLKLSVDYNYPKKSSTPINFPSQTSPTPDNINTSSTNHSSSHIANNNSSSDLRDIQELKVKYDAIVEYTVHLTAERDMIVAQLETLKKEYNNEMNKKKAENKSRIEEEKKNIPPVTTVSEWFTI